jgi:ketosteroid isomerase-like protein
MIKSGLEAMSDRDVPALLELLHQEVEWRPPQQGTLEDVYRGHEGVERLFDNLLDVWERIGHEPTNLVDGHDEAVVVTHVNMRARLSGLEIDEVWAYYLQFRDEKIWRVQMYTDPAQALSEHSSAMLANAPSWPSRR